MATHQRSQSRRKRSRNAGTETQRIAGQMRRAWKGQAWHGPSLSEVLRGIDARAAAARPLPGAHSIWELALHIASWDVVIRRRLAGEVFAVTKQEDWPAVSEPATAAQWRKTVRALDAAHAKLIAAARRFPQDRLHDRVRGKKYSFYVMLHGIVQHDLYHAGQIALLKRALVP
ncbi:MAG TPA: DinB family protein [Terriglobales bacterium]|nr:DinB family protein [Terriglobales bacterium]